ncbi:MAG: TfoX/Sxy family protein [Thermoleophilia bacterium]|nr:TfoX/Sxy family protein [Thermoleophilia bacterium]
MRRDASGRIESELRDLPNVGPVLERSLREVGIETPEHLRSVGAREAFVRIRAAADPGACLHMLYGLEGAVRGVPDKLLPDDVKRGLRDFCRSLDAGRLPVKGGNVERRNVESAGGD